MTTGAGVCAGAETYAENMPSNVLILRSFYMIAFPFNQIFCQTSEDRSSSSHARLHPESHPNARPVPHRQWQDIHNDPGFWLPKPENLPWSIT